MNVNEPNIYSDIRRQYESDEGREFYKTVMGDGGPDIHYGIYKTNNTTMREATLAATSALLQLVEKHMEVAEVNRVVDLGSGCGGAAHQLAKKLGAQITCVDLCQRHHDENLGIARVHGIEASIETHFGSFDSLPAEFAERFDLAWSQEALCHAVDIAGVVAEIYRCLRVGGVVAISDIMLCNEVDAERASAFSDVNAVVNLTRPCLLRRCLMDEGLTVLEEEDWSEHLEKNFQMMKQQIDSGRDRLCSGNVSAATLQRFGESLEQRMEWTRGEVLHWGVFVARK